MILHKQFMITYFSTKMERQSQGKELGQRNVNTSHLKLATI